MKLRKDDNVIVIAGRDKGKTGKIVAVLPRANQVVVENINVVKRHTKPSSKQPRGGILDVTKPIDASKVMVLDPASGNPARVGYQFGKDGSKERVFKVSANHTKSAKPAAADKSKAAAVTKPAAKKTTKTGESKK